jgi:pimeloyl-ACP methyl ester carboxylesterase
MDTPTLVFVHGVGMWPGLFAAVRSKLPGTHVTAARPGYDSQPASASFEAQVDALAEVCAPQRRVILVGVSGGATLGLALALRQPAYLEGLVTHEPLIGPLEPALHERLANAGEAFIQQPSPEAAMAFVERWYGPNSWSRLPERASRWSNRHWETICGEVTQFASFAPMVSDLATIEIPHITTVGENSGPEQKSVAGLLMDNGAHAQVIPDAGHLVLTENPDGFVIAAKRVRADVVAYADAMTNQIDKEPT